MLRDRGILLLAVGQTLVWAGLYYSFPAQLLFWEQDLGWSKVDLTGALTLALLMSGLMSPVGGLLIDRGQGAALMAGSAVLGGIGLLALSQVSSLWGFYVAWAAVGVAMSGCLYEPCFAFVTRARGSEAKRGIVLITLFAGFAGTLSFPMNTALAEAFGWRWAVTVIGVGIIAVVAPILWWGARIVGPAGTTNANAEEEAVETSRRFLRRPEFWLLGAGFSLVAMVHGAALHHLLPILDEQALPDKVAVFAASCIGPAQVAGRVAMITVGRHVSHRNLVITACFSIGASVLLLAYSSASLWILALAILCFGGAYGTVSILRPLVAREILGNNHFGAKHGALALPFLVGSALAPVVGALIWRRWDYDTLLWLLASLAALGCALYVASDRRAVKRAADQV